MSAEDLEKCVRGEIEPEEYVRRLKEEVALHRQRYVIGWNPPSEGLSRIEVVILELLFFAFGVLVGLVLS